jgi:hypothetical protein
MRPMFLAAASLSFCLTAMPAAAQSTDQFNNLVPPSLNYDNPAERELYRDGSATALQRLARVCNGTAVRDRLTCDRAWREINAAYADLQTRKAAASLSR